MTGVYLGAMGWSYDFWPIYKDQPSNKYLKHYSEHFNSVEVNNTFYRIPRKSSVEKWRKETPEGFIFSVKIPQSISHSKELNYDPEKLDVFLDIVSLFKEKLGPLLLQLPPRLNSEHMEQLDTLLTQLSDHKVAVEFRHKDWFNESTYNLFRSHKAALVYVEHPWQPTAMVETGDFSYIRLEGDRRKVDGEKGVTEVDRSIDNLRWAEKLMRESNEKRLAYLYVSKYYSGYPPEDVKKITQSLESLKEP